MQLEWYEHFADGCFRDSEPPCSSACPLGLDVRKFADKARNGKWNSAYRIYREHVLFPMIVSTVCHKPCSGACVRGKRDQYVDLRLVEHACAEKAGSRPRKFKLPERPEHIAVVGAGMDGLACALRLVSHGFGVTVFEMGESLGGSVLNMMDRDICREDIDISFSIYDRVAFNMGVRVTSDSELEGFDAAYIAVNSEWRREMNIGDGPGVFMTQAENGGVPVTERMAYGLNAADHIEFWFQLGDKAEYTDIYSQNEPDPRYYELEYEDAGTDNGAGSADAAAAEAARCYQCNCGECYKVCPLMQREKQFPPRMTAYVIGTIWPNATRRPGVKMLTGCTMCGKCAEACPEGIDMGECLREARKDMFERGNFAPAFHEYWMDELDFVQSDEAYLLYKSETDAETVSHVFFPGCQLGASDPELVKRSYEFVEAACESSALLLSCCGITAEWAGDEAKREEVTDRIRSEWERLGRPVFVTACTACQANLSRFLPEIEVISLYTMMDEHKDVLDRYRCDAKPGKAEAVIYDPCGAAGFGAVRDSVRSLASGAGLSAADSSAEGFRLPACCGFGGHIYPSNPDLADAVEADIPEDTELVVYCANCRDVFAGKGYRVHHILEYIFGKCDTVYTAPDPTERRRNRITLKEHYTGESSVDEQRKYEVRIPDSVRYNMSRLLILEGQVYDALEQAEDSGEKFFDREAGLYYASRKFRNMTLWVSYKKEAEGVFLIEDVYRHRLEIKE